MAAAFLGRAGAYVDALQSEDRQVMKDVLIRNIYASKLPADDCVEKLIDYVHAFSMSLDRLALDAFTSENVSQTLMIKAIKE